MGNADSTERIAKHSSSAVTNEEIPFKHLIAYFEDETTSQERLPLSCTENEKQCSSSQRVTRRINYEQTLSDIIQKEIQYYHSLIATGGMNEYQSPLLGQTLFSSTGSGYQTRPRAKFFIPEKKSEFIKNELQKMIEEYQLFMLNLAAKYGQYRKDVESLNKFLDSLEHIPMSIQLLWRCHLLHPALYYRDCTKHFGFILSPNIRSKATNEYYNMITQCASHNHSNDDLSRMSSYLAFASKTYMKWRTKWNKNIIYNESNMFTDLDFKVTVIKQLEFMSKTNCVVWRKNFFGNIDGYIAKYTQYLQTGAMLLMNGKNIKFEFDALSPTYNIDLLWHTHMMYPYIYRKDCVNITNGLILDHDDTSVGDNDGNNNGYWKYGRLGQFKTVHYISVVLRERYELIVAGYVRENTQKHNEEIIIPNEVLGIVRNAYFNEELIRGNELSPEPPLVDQGQAFCKYGPECCVGDHINFSSDANSAGRFGGRFGGFPGASGGLNMGVNRLNRGYQT